jgi:hypothetical protein
MFANPLVRYRCIKSLMLKCGSDTAILIDFSCYNIFPESDLYVRKMFQLEHNVNMRPDLALVDPCVLVTMTDDELAEGTVLAQAVLHNKLRQKLLQDVLKEKSDDTSVFGKEGPLRCRSCKSSSVAWDQKQTRSADEASTVRLARALPTGGGENLLLFLTFRCSVAARSAARGG